MRAAVSQLALKGRQVRLLSSTLRTFSSEALEGEQEVKRMVNISIIYIIIQLMLRFLFFIYSTPFQFHFFTSFICV